MKNIINRIFLSFATLAALISCNKENMTEQTSGSSYELSVKASVENLANETDTRTYIDGTQILWSESEKMTVFLINGTDVSSATSSNFLGANESQAMFSFSIRNVPESGPYTYGGIYPSSADNGITSKTTNDKVELPAIQSATATSYDPAAYIMVAKPETFETAQTEWIASYRRATALNKMTLTNVGEDIKSVEITVPEGKYLAGRRYIDIATGESGEIYYGETNKLTVNYVSTALPHTAADVWFTSWEVLVAEGENVTVKVSTDSKIYTKTISARSEGIKFLENYLNTITIDMSDAEIEEVGETPGIQEGEYLIAAFNGSNWAIMTSTLNGKYFDPEQTSVTKSDVTCADFYGIQDIDSHVWNISTFENGYSIRSAATSKYFDIAGEKAVAYSDTPVTLNILDNGDGTVSISGSNSSFGYLRYNSQSPRFTTYKSGQTPVALIPWVADLTPRIFVEESALSVSGEASNGAINYSVKNADASDIQVSIKESDASWITAENVPAENKVSYSIQANDGEERSATIVLSLSGADDIAITISQLAAGDVIYTLTITPDDFVKSGYADNNKVHTLIAAGSDGSSYDINITTNQVMQSSDSKIQCQRSSAYFYNTTKFAELIDVTMNDVTGGPFTMFVGNTENPTSGVSVENIDNTFTPGETVNYFVLKCGSKTGYCSEIVIRFKL